MITLTKINEGATVWGGNGFGTTTSSARWRVVFNGEELPFTLYAEDREYMGPAPAWNLVVQVPGEPRDRYYTVKRFYAPRSGGGAAKLAKEWVKSNEAELMRLVYQEQGLGRVAR